MKRLLPIFICGAIVACQTNKAGPAGAKGDTGADGAQGGQGPTGDAGAAGICDTSSCPQVTSINGLAGGSVNGPVSFVGTVTLSYGTGTPTGVVIESGGKQTSVGGFWCGTSIAIDGAINVQGASGSTYSGLTPKRRAKQLCEDTCKGNAAAHPCLTSEIQNAQFLRGGGGSDGNAAIPMPPDGITGWVLSPNPIDSCTDLSTESGNGIVYRITGDEGSFATLSCADVTHGLNCCL